MNKLLLLLLLISSPLNAKQYKVDMSQSYLNFSGVHADKPFNGEFKEWRAEIEFDAAKPENSHINVEINTKSAATGEVIYDGTLPKQDWFNVEKFPIATFKSDKISKNADGSFKMEGTLTIKDISKPISFDFNLQENAPTQADFSIKINRLDYDIGKESDAQAEWVEKNITLKAHIVAN